MQSAGCLCVQASCTVSASSMIDWRDSRDGGRPSPVLCNLSRLGPAAFRRMGMGWILHAPADAIPRGQCGVGWQSARLGLDWHGPEAAAEAGHILLQPDRQAILQGLPVSQPGSFKHVRAVMYLPRVALPLPCRPIFMTLDKPCSCRHVAPSRVAVWEAAVS